MKSILLTVIIISVALVHQGRGAPHAHLQPCQEPATPGAYNTFARRHIITETFDRNSLQEWARYLRNNNLCGRVPTQSFIDAEEADVRRICSYSGRRVNNAPQAQGDFCMSNAIMRLYDVDSDKRCNIWRLAAVNHYVIVRCAQVDGTCLPIHFERFRNQKPSKTPCTPRRIG
ncbi:seminal ribonuclease-like [Xyrichtys novacula]|uniref:Seminal ribonuclease-like n=1 Tax=Xyrichtys novacula TaxID=13765 RepID=A0AAV1ESN1_XYRNO|nr:seminal ribonuclease-like [Xyrichtys novacula]